MGRYDKLDPNATHKICVCCETLKPMCDYHNSKNSADGKVSRCKDCINNRVKRVNYENLRLKNEPTREDVIASYGGEKRCTRCKEIKPLEDFYNNKRSKDGLTYRCAECTKEVRREQYWEDPEKYKEQSAKYYEENREEHIARSTRWKKKNPELARKYAREYAQRKAQERSQSDNNV